MNATLDGLRESLDDTQCPPLRQGASKPSLQDVLRCTLEFARHCLDREDVSAAVKVLGCAAVLAPADPAIRVQCGLLHLVLGSPEAAQTDFLEALQLDARNDMAHAGLSRCYAAQGSHLEAEACARRALALAPANPVALEVLSAAAPFESNGQANPRDPATAPAADRPALIQAPGQPGDTRTVIPLTPTPGNEVNGNPSPSPARSPSVSSATRNPSFEDLQKFYASAAEQFADVEPPQLDELHLKNGRLLPGREQLLPLLPRGGICAEVGTQTGDFAKYLLWVLRPVKLHLFDLDFSLFDRAHFHSAIRQGNVELHEGDSASSLAAMPDRSFDFIYIDGDHSYAGVVRDLAQAARKIKDDGWIVCNDYTLYSPLEGIKYGVSRAVNEFCLKEDFEILYLALHPWGYHDVALRKRQPVAASASPRPTPAPPATFRTTRAAPVRAEPGVVIEEISGHDEMFTGDKTHYFGVGRSALRCIESSLMAAGKTNASIRRILDLPCGHGRVLRFLKAAFPSAHLTACDLNTDAVDFCAKTFGAEPVYSHVDADRIPLSEKFDLIWSGSLLTHLPAQPCGEFIRFFSSRIHPGGLIVFTLHGRWVERSLATGRYKYGLTDEAIAAILAAFHRTGFGYADYRDRAGYGISVSSPAFVLSRLVALPDLKLVSYHEKAWDDHQDVVCLQKQASPDEALG